MPVAAWRHRAWRQRLPPLEVVLLVAVAAWRQRLPPLEVVVVAVAAWRQRLSLEAQFGTETWPCCFDFSHPCN